MYKYIMYKYALPWDLFHHLHSLGSLDGGLHRTISPALVAYAYLSVGSGEGTLCPLQTSQMWGNAHPLAACLQDLHTQHMSTHPCRGSAGPSVAEAVTEAWVAVCAKVSMDILLSLRNKIIDAPSIAGPFQVKVLPEGGLFKTKGVGQKFMADAMNAPVAVMETAGEGGAWGIGILAAYMKNKEESESLSAYLENKVFAGKESTQIAPEPEGTAGFEAFMERYKNGLAIERAAVEHLS